MEQSGGLEWTKCPVNAIQSIDVIGADEIAPMSCPEMLHTEFVAALDHLQLTQVDFASWIGRTPRNVNRWATGAADVPTVIVRLLHSMAATVALSGDQNSLDSTDWFQFDPHEILGVAEGATDGEVKSAYRRLARRYHPDTGGNPEAFRKVKDAFDNMNAP